ncbi:MAG: DUF1320 family protein [Parabacteroides sp.]|nr:DUF1320 family protein [Parabacteroides sp.]
MFLEEGDYKVMIGEKAMDVIQQSSTDNRKRAEKMAIEEVAGYIRSRYDAKAVFDATGENRNDLIVMYTCDIALYHMVSWLPNKMGFEIRETRYKRAVEWLTGVQSGKTMPDLPTPTGPDGEEDFYNPIRFGSMKPNGYDW